MAVSTVPTESLWKGPGEAVRQPNGYERMPSHLELAADRLGLNPEVREFLQRPRREHAVNLSVRLDNGRLKLIRGYRVQHNDALGPCQGTVRFNPRETIESLQAQAMYLSVAHAAVDLPFGGSVGAILCDSADLSDLERERVSREWVRQVYHDGGTLNDMPTVDTGSDTQAIHWMLDELDSMQGGRYSGAASGISAAPGVSLSRVEAQAYGAVYAARDAVLESGVEIRRSNACVYGVGELGRAIMKMYNRLGGTVVAVLCRDRETGRPLTIANEDGIDISLIEEIVDGEGRVDQARVSQYGYQTYASDEWLDLKPEIVFLTAEEETLETLVASRIPGKVKVVVEAVPGVIGPDADDRLNDAGITIVPDLIAASGGLVHGYFERSRSSAYFRWDRDRMLRTLDQIMSTSYRATRRYARTNRLSTRDAAYDIAVSRIVEACCKRGWV